MKARPIVERKTLHRSRFPAGHALLKARRIGFVGFAFGEGHVSRRQSFLFLTRCPKYVGFGGKVTERLFDLEGLVHELESFIPILIGGVSVGHLKGKHFVGWIGSDQRIRPGAPDRLHVLYLDGKRDAHSPSECSPGRYCR